MDAMSGAAPLDGTGGSPARDRTGGTKQTERLLTRHWRRSRSDGNDKGQAAQRRQDGCDIAVSAHGKLTEQPADHEASQL